MRVLVICGPTASGKTQLAHSLAQRLYGEIVNADSMQLYQSLEIVTASPNTKLQQQLPYHLYNFVSPECNFSASQYALAASGVIKDIAARGKLPIIVGGSGLYINMLKNGYSDMPNITQNNRSYVQNLRQQLGAADFFIELTKLDPRAASNLNAGDTKRVQRAYEIAYQTGKTIDYFQQQPKIQPLATADFKVILLQPEREFLYQTINQRFKQLLDHGAIEEVRKFECKYGQLTTTATKALGFSEIMAYLHQQISQEQLIESACQNTRNYAKRQITWFKHQLTTDLELRFTDDRQYQQLITELDITTLLN